MSNIAIYGRKSKYTNRGESIENQITKCKKFIEFKPDVVTMDITMPVMDGIEALRRIREIDSQAKVVMVTAAGQANKMYEAVKYGASEFLAKPFEPEQISEIINRILEV